MLVWTSSLSSRRLVHHTGPNDSPIQKVATGFRLGLAVMALGAWLAAPAVCAQTDPGYFEVRSASVELDAGVYYLNAWIEFRLSTEARQALESGLPLIIRVEVELLNRRRFWIDTERATLRQMYRLEYHALTERYIVENINSGDETSFATLFSALNYLGRLDGLPVLDSALLESPRGHDMRIRAVLDTEQLPGPLRLLAFWRRDWSLGSDWYRWQLDEE
jgi:hypothetical protein